MKKYLIAASLLFLATTAHAAPLSQPCYTDPSSPNTCIGAAAATPLPVTLDGGGGGSVTANQGTPNAGGATNSWPVQGAGTAGTPAGGVVSVQGVSGGTAVPVTISGGSGGDVTTTPGERTIIALDISTVTTGGVAVTALTAGHRTAGGFLVNPKAATIDLCINEQTTASGTTTVGGLVCIPPGGSYNLTPSALAVSVITSDSTHPFGGEGLI